MDQGPGPAGEKSGTAARLAIVAALAIVLAGGIAIALALGPERTTFAKASAPAQRIKALKPAAAAAHCSLRSFREEGDGRSSKPVHYVSDPPHSGKHSALPAPDRPFYTDPPPTEQLVHALRHGRVVIWFDPDLGEEEKGRLKDVFAEDPPHMILVPRPSMSPAVAASAWTHVLACDDFNARVYDAIRAFRYRYRDQGPEFVP